MVASSVAGGIKAKRAAQQATDELNKQDHNNTLDYIRRSGIDYTQTAAAQSALNSASEYGKELVRNARGVAGVMGGGNAAVRSAQDAAAQGMAKVTQSIAAEGQARQDAADSDYQARKQRLSDAYMSMYNQQAANATNAANAGIQAGMDMAGVDFYSHLNNGQGIVGEIFKNKNWKS